MPNKSIVLMVGAAALAFGLILSGCNRNNRSATAMKTTRNPSSAAQGARPAEVLSASAFRPPAYSAPEAAPTLAQVRPQPVQPQPVQPQYATAQYVQPRPAATYTPQPRYAQASVSQPQYATVQYAPSEAYYDNPQLAYAHAVHFSSAPVRPVQPTPDLAMAKAALPPPVPVRPAAVEVVPAGYQRAPLPELEPARFQRLPTDRGAARPAAELMMSSGAAGTDRQEIQRALAPLADARSQPDSRQGWVASPVTAMRRGY